MRRLAPFCRLVVLTLSWLAGIGIAGSALPVHAQITQSTVGHQVVMAREDVQLHERDPATGRDRVTGVVADANARLDKIQGNWIWIRTSGQKGWISIDDAVPANEAITYFTGRIQQNPDDAFAYNQRSSARLANQDFDGGMADIDQAIRLVPDKSELRHNRGFLWHQSGQHHRALADYDHALRLDPGNALAYCHRGQCYFTLGQYDKALADATAAIRLLPGYATAYGDRGWIWLEKKEYAIALADFDESIRLDPKLAGSYRGRAKTLQGRNEDEKALADFDQALRLVPSWAIVISERGWSWFNTRRYDKALADFDEALRINPEIAYAYQGRGRANQQLRSYEAAATAFDEFIRRMPASALPYLERGWLRLDLKQAEQALSDFNEALRIDPSSAAARRGRGKCQIALKNWDQALTELDEAIRLLPNWAWVYKDRGEVWFAKREFDRSIDDFSTAIRLEPKYPEAYRGRAVCWRIKRDFERALADINEAMRQAPGDWNNVYQRASVFRSSKQYPLALADYSQAIELNPGDAGIVAARGYAHFLHGRYEQASADFDQANKINPQHGWAYRDRAMMFATCPDDKYRDGAKAREQLEKAQELMPPAANVYEAQAALAAENGDFDEAVRWQEKVLEDAAWKLIPEMQARLEVYRAKQPYRAGMQLPDVPISVAAADSTSPRPHTVAFQEAPAEEGFISIFDGQSLNGWKGDIAQWSAADGVLHGKVAGEPQRKSMFLVWQGTADDFELKLKFRLNQGNSGIQFRSADLGDGVIAGYQADMGFKDTAGNPITGRIFDEKIRKHAFLNAKQGQAIEIDAAGAVRVVGTTATDAELAPLVVLSEPGYSSWHDYRISARGDQIVLTVDGVVTTKLTDHDPNVRRSGVIALQMWGKADVEFKDILFKRLDRPSTGPPGGTEEDFALQPAVNPAPPKPHADLDLLRGTWVCVLALKEGEAVENYVGVRAVIDGDSLTWLFPKNDGGYREQKNKFRIDPTANPKHFDWWPENKPQSVDPRIYTITKNMLRWGTNLDGKTRPPSFDDARWQFTMKRVVAADQKK